MPAKETQKPLIPSRQVKAMSRDDEEAQPTNACAHAASIEHDEDDDDDDCSFNGMEVEDWLIKQQAKTPDGWDQEALKRSEAKVAEESLHDDALVNERKGDGKGILPQEERKRPSTVGNAPTIVELPPATETLVLDPTVIFDAEAKTLASYENFVVAEMSPHDEQVLVIEGVKTMHPRRKRILMVLGVLAVATLVAGAAGTISKIFLSSRSATSGGETSLVANTTATTMPPVSTIISRGGNLSLTIGEAWGSLAPGGLETFAAQNGALDYFQKWISRTDRNFTYFSASKKANTLGGIGLSLIQKALSPLWNGHVVRTFTVILSTAVSFSLPLTMSFS
jgi:hypothetical protein